MAFIARKRVNDVPVEGFDTPRGTIWVRRHAKQSTTLLPKAPHKRARNKGWKLYVNAGVEEGP